MFSNRGKIKWWYNRLLYNQLHMAYLNYFDKRISTIKYIKPPKELLQVYMYLWLLMYTYEWLWLYVHVCAYIFA